MKIEENIFKKVKIDEEKLIKYGFDKESKGYKYSTKIMNNSFRVDIFVSKKGEVLGKIYDLNLDEEYTNFRIKDVNGEFVNKVKNEYIKLLEEIKRNCFKEEYFVLEQANRITNIIKEKYDIIPEFLWDNFEGGVFRNKRSSKWFGVIMNIDKSKIIPKENGEVEILNLKLDNDVEKYLKIRGIYPAYHMNKKNWVSIILDDTICDNKILELIDISFKNSDVIGEWIFPANPKYYDVIDAFEKEDKILWHETKGILKGDIVYIYVVKPYSSIMFKCEVLETDISKNNDKRKIMRIKLLKKYKRDEFNIEKLKKLGVKSVRGPRRITKDLSEELKN